MFIPPKKPVRVAGQMKEEGEEVAPIVPTSNMKIQAAGQAASMPASTGQMQTNMMKPPAEYKGAEPDAAPPGNTGGGTAAGHAAPAPAPVVSAPASRGAGVPDMGNLGGLNRDPRLNRPTVTPPTPTPDPNQAILDAINQIIGKGPRSTAEDEMLINDKMINTIGTNSNNVGARMGVGGGGSSGYYAKELEGVSNDANLDATTKILAARQAARDEYVKNTQVGAGLYFGSQQNDRANAGEDRADTDFRNGIQDDNAESNPNWNDGNGDGKDDMTGATQEQVQLSDFIAKTSGGVGSYAAASAAGHKDNPIRINTPDLAQKIVRAGFQPQPDDWFGNAVWFDPTTQSYYLVPKEYR